MEEFSIHKYLLTCEAILSHSDVIKESLYSIKYNIATSAITEKYQNTLRAVQVIA